MSERDPRVRAWCLDMVEAVRALSPATASRYGDLGRLEHYIQTAEFFGAKLPEEPALAQSAFLHGVWDVSLLDGLQAGLEPRVRDILTDRKRLRAIVNPDEEVPHRLVTNVLPQLTCAVSGLLLVVEQLLHVDPDETFAQFAEDFCIHPRQPPTPSSPLPPLGFDTLPSQLEYLRLVVVPTSEFFGLWFYRNLAEDLCLFHSDATRFRELCRFAQEQIIEAEHRTSVIRSAVEDLVDAETAEVSWRWHHIASLDRRLPRDAREFKSRFSNCGTVTVVCREPSECYQAIARLHATGTFRHQTRDIEDSIGSPTMSGYEAFHTTVTPAAGVPAIRVRVTHRRAQETAHRRLSQRTLELMQHQVDATESNTLRVFANDGRSVSLPAGSTVLNFVHTINGDFVGLALRAFVNGDARDLLHPLRTGDVVRLDIGTDRRDLPIGWDTRVPADTVASIRRAHERQYRPRQVKQGRVIVRTRLAERNVQDILDDRVYDDQTVDGFLDEAIEAVAQTGNQPQRLPNVASWLRQFFARKGDDGTGSDASDVLTRILDETAARMTRASKTGIEELTIPASLNGTFDHWVLCEKCLPTVGQPVVGRVRRRSLEIHIAGRPCATAGCERIDWTLRYRRGQYLVIEMVNRQGIAAEVLSCIARLGIHILDLVSGNLGPSWAALRVHVRPLGPELLASVEKELKAIEGVIRVVRPDQPVVPVLEGVLPARASSRPLFFVQHSPFQCGPPLQDDQHFYGRDAERATLRLLFQQARSPEAVHGVMAWVKGPYKTGKTSLVDCFVRELRRTEYQCEVIGTSAEFTEAWPDLEARLRAKVAERLHESRLARREYEPAEGAAPPSLGQLISQFRTTTNHSLVLVIDEAVNMFLRTKDEEPLLNLFSCVQNSPGVLVIWVGPEAPVMKLSEQLRAGLRAVDSIEVRGLAPTHIRHLLQADNMRDRGLSIQVDERVVKDVIRFTRGNAYWCNLLAHTLFQQHEHANGKPHFGLPALERAKGELVQKALPFSDRLEDFEPDNRPLGIVTVILKALAMSYKESRRGLTYEMLMEAAGEAGVIIGWKQLDSVLEMLRARGSIRTNGERDNAWEIEAPVLVEHILYQLHKHGSNRLG